MKDKQMDIGFLIKKIGETMGKQANREMQSCGLTLGQGHMLMVLSCAGEDGRSLKELEKYFHVAQPTIVGTVSRLEKKQLIVRFSDPTDRRIKRVRLTEKGVEQCLSGREKMKRADARLVSGLTEPERQELLRLLQIVYNTIREDG